MGCKWEVSQWGPVGVLGKRDWEVAYVGPSLVAVIKTMYRLKKRGSGRAVRVIWRP